MNAKRQLLIDTAMHLFYEQGVHAIGINEVLKVSGVAKKTLYNHFESKDALILAALMQRHDTFMDWLKGVLQGATSDKEVVNNLFNALTQWFSGRVTQLGDFRGCFFINTSAEFSDSASDISVYCQFHKQQVRELISSHLSGPTETLLDTICIVKEGAITTAYVANDKTAAQKCLPIFRHILQ
jgi:AcrR family transcriptional regulator